LSEIRTYRISDLAGNFLDLVVKVRRERYEIEAGILALNYSGGAQSDTAKSDYPSKSVEKNTIEFGELRGRGEPNPLLAVKQELRLTTGDLQTSFAARWDVLHDETDIFVSSSSGPQHREKHGLDLVRIRTDKGKISVDE
jgi:hypothetical protein